MLIKPDDVSLNKAAVIERCIRRIQEEYAANPELNDYTHVDALTLNIERACQAAIDLAMHIVSTHHLGMPQSSADGFSLLEKAGIITESLAKTMRAMTGFRNVAVHQYQELDTDILAVIASRGWKDLVAFCQALGMVVKV